MAPMQRLATCFFLIISPGAVLGQSSSIPDVEPAAAFVPATPVAGAPLQEAETLQLTDAVIERLVTEQDVSEYAEYFAFDDSTAASDARVRRAASASCKTFPGDLAWPKEIVWDIFNVLLGGALIPTKPIAASCYDSKWGKKDGAKCTEVANKFTDPLFHHADPTSSGWFLSTKLT